MKTLIRKFIIFCVIGVLGAIIDLLVFNSLFWLKIPFNISRVLAILVSITFNFSLNRNITFKARNKSIKKQYPKHLIVYTAVLITNTLVGSIAFHLLGDSTFNANIASIAGIVSAIPISFFGSMFWTFKK